MIDHRIHLHTLRVGGGRVLMTGKQGAHTGFAQQTSGIDRLITEVVVGELLHLLPLLRLRVGWRGHEGELLTPVQHLRQQACHGFPQHVFLGFPLDPQFGRHLHRHRSQMVIQEGGSCLHGIGHVDPIATPGEDLALQHGLDPDVLGLVQGMAPVQLIRIQLRGNRLARGVTLQGCGMGFRQKLRHQRRAGQPGLKATGGEANHRIKIGVIHLVFSQHRPLHQGIGLLQQAFPAGALLLRQVIETVEEHVAAKGGIAAEQLI